LRPHAPPPGKKPPGWSGGPLPSGTRDLPHHDSVAGKGAGGVGRVVEQRTFGQHRPWTKARQHGDGTVQATHDFYLTVLHDAGPVTGGGLVEQPGPSLIGLLCALTE